MTQYTVCYICSKVWCSSRNCETPTCQQACLEEFAWDSKHKDSNVTYDFCGTCRKKMTDSFERQFRRPK